MGGLGFGFKWNMGWMNDFLSYMSGPDLSPFHPWHVTFSLLYAFHEHFVLVLSHDEVVHGKGSLIEKMPGDLWQKFANLRMFFAWMWAHPGKKLFFMGSEFGSMEGVESQPGLDWHLAHCRMHDGLRRLVQHLNWLYSMSPRSSIWTTPSEGFEWIDFHDSDNGSGPLCARAGTRHSSSW